MKATISYIALRPVLWALEQWILLLFYSVLKYGNGDGMRGDPRTYEWQSQPPAWIAQPGRKPSGRYQGIPRHIG